MTTFSIKTQDIRAGGFTLRFGVHNDDSNTCFLQVTGATEGQQIIFQRDGDVLTIRPIQVVGDAPAAETATVDAVWPDADAESDAIDPAFVRA